MVNWTKIVQERITKVPISAGRSAKLGKISFDDLIFLPAQLAKRPVDYFKEPISSKTIIGKNSAKPFEIETPIIIAAMSFGALSRQAKTALAKASTLADTIENTGEGGVLPEERQFAKHLIVQYSTARFGITEDVLKKADMIEIKIGQGAKGGQGGLLPKEKITSAIAQIRNITPGQDVHSPAYHLDIKTCKDLKNKVEWLRQISGGVPIGIKLAAGDIENDIKIAVSANPDIIAIDGHEGGTGAAPAVMLNEIGLPTLAATVLARTTLDKLEAQQELWIGGGFFDGASIAKALALGADAVFMGSAMLGALGCIACDLCYLGKCPKGITTQDEELAKHLDIETASQNAANYIKNCTEEIKMIAGAVGHNNVHKLAKDDLRALTREMAKITKVRLIGE